MFATIQDARHLLPDLPSFLHMLNDSGDLVKPWEPAPYITVLLGLREKDIIPRIHVLCHKTEPDRFLNLLYTDRPKAMQKVEAPSSSTAYLVEAMVFTCFNKSRLSYKRDNLIAPNKAIVLASCPRDALTAHEKLHAASAQQRWDAA